MPQATTVPFRPLPLFSGPHAQTVLGSAGVVSRSPPSVTELVDLDDGDRIALEVSTPDDWRPDRPTVVLIHGLCGCHRSSYMTRVARKLWLRGIRAVRMNLRGCGSGGGLARGLYHSGRSDDALAVARDLAERWPESPISLVGFSLGGNIALKLAGELGEDARPLLERIVAVCPPADLAACARMLSRPQNRFYDWWFVSQLRADVAARHRVFPDLGPVSLPSRLTLYGFDDVYTAPRSGFRDADDYYLRSSSAPLAPRITVECTVLFADDDPFIDARALDGLPLPDNVDVVRVPRGGHMGFLGRPGSPGGCRWMDARLLEWLGT